MKANSHFSKSRRRAFYSPSNRVTAVPASSPFASRAAVLATLATTFTMNALAGTTGMPWETGLTSIQRSMSGPVMLAFGVIVIVAIAITLAFAGEITEILKRTGSSVLALGAGFGALAMVGTLFAVTGATI